MMNLIRMVIKKEELSKKKKAFVKEEFQKNYNNCRKFEGKYHNYKRMVT